MKSLFTFAALASLYAIFNPCQAQDAVIPPVVWESKRVEMGTVLEENGPVVSKFTFTSTSEEGLVLEEIITDCGCTTADYTKDTLFNGQTGEIAVAFDPSSRGGEVVKTIIVKYNQDPYLDTLLLEGFNVPYPTNAERFYPVNKAGIGFRLPVIHMGNVINNEPKRKYVDFFNFKGYPVQLSEVQESLPEHIQIRLIPAVVTAHTRGVLEISYDGDIKDDLGFFEEDLSFTILSDEKGQLDFKLIANVFDYFAPTPASELNNVPRLAIRELEIDLSKISSRVPISRMVTLSNEGKQDLEIRKVSVNCDCVSVLVPTTTLTPGQKTDLTVTFDPKHRRGIDHRAITIFTNDPIQPAQTVLVKSRIN